MAASLDIIGVSKAYDKKRVLDDISFQVNQGEFVVLVGPSGCGKSTVLRIVAGLEQVSEGSVRIGSREVTKFEPKDRNIAMVFQDYALYPHKSVYENIAFGLRIRKFSPADIDRRVQDAAEKLDLKSYLQRRPAALSGGQRQRVAIGRAIVRQPDVFLFDEPLSNLDAKLRGSMRLSIAKLHKELKATIVYVTHDQIEAMTLADKIVVLNDGVIQQMGAPLDLYYYPRNVFVATFIGSPPMNMIHGRLADEQGLTFISDKGLQFKIPKTVLSHLLPEARPGKKVVLGIRAENLVDSQQGRTDIHFTAKVLVTEPLGASTSVYCAIGGHEVQITLPEPSRPSVGDQLNLTWWAEHIYLFDAETTLSLVKNPGS